MGIPMAHSEVGASRRGERRSDHRAGGDGQPAPRRRRKGGATAHNLQGAEAAGEICSRAQALIARR